MCSLAGIVAWHLRNTHRRKKTSAKSAARFSFMMLGSGAAEKSAIVPLTDLEDVDCPRKISLPSDPFAGSGWKPQIKSVTLPSGVTVPPVAITAPERSPMSQDEYPLTPNSGLELSPLPTPPPAYRILALHTIPIPSPPPEKGSPYVPPPTPMHRNPGRRDSTSEYKSFDLPPVPAGPSLSPRSASFNHMADSPSSSQAGFSTATGPPKSLPRLMVVSTPYQPTLHDEIGLRTGETLRLLKEFDDEWCLVQRVGCPNAEKGVVPRLCLSERPPMIKNYAKISNSIFNGARRK